MASVTNREMAERLKWSPQQQERFRETRLRAVLEMAAQRVPYYSRKLKQQGITVRDLKHLRDIFLLPITTRADLETESSQFLAEGVESAQCVCRRKPGGSASAMGIYWSADEAAALQAIEERIIESNGISGRHSRLTIVPPSQIPSARPGFLERMRRGRHEYVSANETPVEQARLMREMRPEFLSAPLWVLNRVAAEIEKSGPLGFAPILLMTWGEPLRKADRERLKTAFGVEPTDIYETWEFGPIAAEGPEHDGLRVSFDLVYIEILQGERHVMPGEIGEVVITSLSNKTMPLIRYRVGDLASWKKSAPGAAWQGPTLEAVHGRVTDAVVMPSGHYITARRFEETLDQFENIDAYRCIQSEPRKVEVLFVPGDLFSARTAELLRSRCIELFNNQLGVELRPMKELPLLQSHRRRSIVCRLAHGS